MRPGWRCSTGLMTSCAPPAVGSSCTGPGGWPAVRGDHRPGHRLAHLTGDRTQPLPATISTIAELPSPTEASAANQPARRPPDAYHRTDRPETKMTGGDAATTDYASGQSPSGDSSATAPVLP